MAVPDDDAPGPLMTTRTALILTISLLSGLGAGALVGYSEYHVAEAVIGGIGVFIAAVKLMHQWVASDQPNRSHVARPEAAEGKRQCRKPAAIRFIDRRAAELAVLLADAARAEAAKATRAAECRAGGLEADLTRATGVITELRRRIAALERQRDAWRAATGARYPHELGNAPEAVSSP